MKAVLRIVLCSLLTFPAVASATGESVGTIETLTGKRYHDCHIVRVHPDGVSFRHDIGAAKILFTDLPQKWRSKFGYDPAKAEAYEKELAKARAEQQERLEKRYAEMAEAQRRAHEMQLARLRAAERQAAAYAPMPLIPGGGPVPFIGSALGNTTFAYGPQSRITGPAFGGRRWSQRGGLLYGNGFYSLGGGSGGTLTVGSFSPLPRFRGGFFPGAYYGGGFGSPAFTQRPPFNGFFAVPGIGPNVIGTPSAISVRSGGVSLTIGR